MNSSIRILIVTETVTCDSASWQSTTTPSKPMTHDKIYYFLPYWDNKPCMHIRSVWADLRRRMYNSNIIAKIVEKYVSTRKIWPLDRRSTIPHTLLGFPFMVPIPYPLSFPIFSSFFYLIFSQEDALAEVNTAIETDQPKVEILLRQVLEDLSTACTQYVNLSKAPVTGPGTGKTKLDKERLKLCQKEIVSVKLFNIFIILY